MRKDGDLTTFADLVTAAGLQEIGSYADGIGPCKNLVITRDQAGNLFEPSGVVTDAHAADLVVHPFTFRVENQFLPLELRNSADGNVGDLVGELHAFLRAGVDGFITHNPAIRVTAVQQPPWTPPVQLAAPYSGFSPPTRRGHP